MSQRGGSHTSIQISLKIKTGDSSPHQVDFCLKYLQSLEGSQVCLLGSEHFLICSSTSQIYLQFSLSQTNSSSFPKQPAPLSSNSMPIGFSVNQNVSNPSLYHYTESGVDLLLLAWFSSFYLSLSPLKKKSSWVPHLPELSCSIFLSLH